MDLQINIDKNINLIDNFFKLNSDFNFIDYKKFNISINNLTNIELMNDYYINGKNNNLICSIKDFYKIYPNFDIFFYKKLYRDIIFEKNIDLFVHYHTIGKHENKIVCLNDFINNYYVDFTFIKSFYSDLTDKNIFDLIRSIINKRDDYICSEKDFNKKFPNFDIILYKLSNRDLQLENDIKYKSYWYNNKKEDKICTNIDIKLYKYIYNIEEFTNEDIKYFHNNIDKLIYNLDTLYNFVTDFNYSLFLKYFPSKAKHKKENIIEFYMLNIDKNNMVYSHKLFYLKYPKFNMNEYKKFNVRSNSTNDITDILSEYLNKENKKNIIISIEDFYDKYPKFDLLFYKDIVYIEKRLLFNNDENYIYDWYNNNLDNYYENTSFYKKYNNFNLNIYKYFNKDIIKNYNNKCILYDFNYNKRYELDIIYSIELFYKKYPNFNKDIYKALNNLEKYNDDELIIHFHSIGLKLNLYYEESMININDFNIRLYKELNKDLDKLTKINLIIHWYKYGKIQDRIFSKESFYQKYGKNELVTEDEIINWMNNDRKDVYNIYEVLLDLSNNLHKKKLDTGISLIIRAKNEEYNLKFCIESVVDLVDEIIFVDNNSTDNTYNIMKEYAEKYKNIKLYRYNINVAKVGIEHQNQINNNNKNTLGTFYNWCLSKATKYNVFKWDADFICIRNNFIELVNKYSLRNRDDKFAIWFSGKTLFENNNNFYLNFNSFYDEYRIFSYKNNFCWYDGNSCEYTDPYLNNVMIQKKYKYMHPLFYELKRTSLDEFQERSSLIDKRDINDFYILNNLKENNIKNLVEIKYELINLNKKIILYTPSLSLGGGNQFIVNFYDLYKSLGFNVLIIPMNYENIGNKKFNSVIEENIINLNNFNIKFIEEFKPDFIIFNSDIPFQLNDIIQLSNITKLFFVTHSDVAYANIFIEKYNKYFYKILTVNDYTIKKLSNKININEKIFLKIINFVENKNIKNNNINVNINININKNKKFGLISRFSEDKNIPMLIFALKEVFKKYKDYICYLVGTNNNIYDTYLKKICKLNDLDKNIIFTGYQDDVFKYYEMFDFIILPSVSEGCSYNIIEAMSLGIPVIVSDVGGNHELVKNNINGIIYPYTNIREYETSKIYIENYNEHLSRIGYFINDNEFKTSYNFTLNIGNTNVNLPYFVTCKKNTHTNCPYCENIKIKKELFNKNVNIIVNSIYTMIEFETEKIKNIKMNNINFIKNKFNKNTYINQLLEFIH